MLSPSISFSRFASTRVIQFWARIIRVSRVACSTVTGNDGQHKMVRFHAKFHTAICLVFVSADSIIDIPTKPRFKSRNSSLVRRRRQRSASLVRWLQGGCVPQRYQQLLEARHRETPWHRLQTATFVIYSRYRSGENNSLSYLWSDGFE